MLFMLALSTSAVSYHHPSPPTVHRPHQQAELEATLAAQGGDSPPIAAVVAPSELSVDGGLLRDELMGMVQGMGGEIVRLSTRLDDVREVSEGGSVYTYFLQ